MDTDLFPVIERLFWGDITGDFPSPAADVLLAHYTSIGNLENIIQGEELWFSNPLYMNDLNELRFGMQVGASETRAHSGLKNSFRDELEYRQLLTFFEVLFQKFENAHAFDTYVFCLSEHKREDEDGILSMWRGYGANGAGVALVFDPKKIAETEGKPLMVSKVSYVDPQAQRLWIQTMLDKVADLIRGKALEPEHLYAIAVNWLDRLKIFALFTKHAGFREENEWRAIYLPERDKSAVFKSMLGYAITNRGVEPKLKLKIAPLSGTFSEGFTMGNIIAKIILGPTLSSSLSRRAVVRLLEKSRSPSLANRVAASSIPFRS